MLIWQLPKLLDLNDRHGRRCCISQGRVGDRWGRSSSRNLPSRLRKALWMNGTKRRGSILCVVLRFLKNSLPIFLLWLKLLNQLIKLASIVIQLISNIIGIYPPCYLFLFLFHSFQFSKFIYVSRLNCSVTNLSVGRKIWTKIIGIIFIKLLWDSSSFIYFPSKYIWYSHIMNPTHKITSSTFIQLKIHKSIT